MMHVQHRFITKPVIPAAVGLGLRSQHYQDVLETQPDIGWFEVHSENYFGKGGAPLHFLEKIREDYPISLHGVGMSLGSVDVLDGRHLSLLKELVARIEPGLVSEHLSWSSSGGEFFNDLAPIPYTDESLSLLTEKITQVQEALRTWILIENPSSYLEYACSTYREADFLNELARRTGCGILLDINNVYVSCQNHGWDAIRYLQTIAAERVGEIHLAGHTVNKVGDKAILIDTHNRPVCPEVWDLYRAAMGLFGAKMTLIEWDTDIPSFSTLMDEADIATGILEESHATG
jgi:uncharacterized protein